MCGPDGADDNNCADAEQSFSSGNGSTMVPASSTDGEKEDQPTNDTDQGDLTALPGVPLPPTPIRGANGAFQGCRRQRRKRQEPYFQVIEKGVLEPSSCGALLGHSSACVASFRCAAHGGTQCQQWRIRGPVLGWSDDAVNLRAVVTVRAVSGMSAQDVYARSVPQLIPSPYSTSSDTYESIRFVWRNQRENGEVAPGASIDTAAGNGELSDEHIKRILKKAAAAQRTAKRKLSKGYVSLVSKAGALDDPVHKAAVREVFRKRSVGAVKDYRQKGAALLRQRTAQLRGLLGVGAVRRVRRYLELKDASAGSRAMRLRVSRGLSQMHLFPSREQLRKIRREDIDAPGRVGHYFLTKAAMGALLRWDYVAGSGSAGIRRYRTACGMEKRLRAHTNKYWDARRPSGESEDASEVEDDGVFFDNSNVEFDGCYAPEELDPVLIAELVVNAQSFLEDDDGTGELLILAVGYDVVAALQQTLDATTAAGLTVADVANGPAAVLTFAADGGKVRRRDLTAYTVSISSPFVESGRTDLTPIMYAFAGEKRVDRAVTKWVRDQVVGLLSTTLYVAAEDPAPPGEVDPQGSEPPLPAEGVHRGSRRHLQPLLLDATVRVCGTFARRTHEEHVPTAERDIALSVSSCRWHSSKCSLEMLLTCSPSHCRWFAPC